MGIFFSKKKNVSRVTEQDKAVLQLKQTRDKIKQYQRRIEQGIEKERQIAKKLLEKGQKDRALLLLRKKKFEEQILSKTDGQLDNLERLVHDLEFAQVEIKVIDGLKVGNTALKKLNDVLSIEDIEKVMDETREGVEKQNEINEILMGTLTDEDEAEAEAELDELLKLDAKETIPETPEAPKIIVTPEEVQLPDVPEELPTIEKDSAKKKKEGKFEEPIALEA
ncbi:charged multivesicular body protein 6 [Leptopilina heterotoma]|uniref:charged multivesicular body protein 6 n=1 Tax=Leptopilina heterotoma TaxID=63436 RepID=UPI001CA8B889|nr:charged multivesicular body protein 6 [Leptopilina heterotoma]